MIKTVPESAFVFNSYYADGKDGTFKDFYGGNKGGRAAADGTWKATWKITENAPAGPVRVAYKAAHIDFKFAEADISFRLVAAGDRCD